MIESNLRTFWGNFFQLTFSTNTKLGGREPKGAMAPWLIIPTFTTNKILNSTINILTSPVGLGPWLCIPFLLTLFLLCFLFILCLTVWGWEGKLGYLWFGGYSIFISQYSNLITLTHYLILIFVTQNFSITLLAMCLKGSSQWVFQFKKSTLSKVVGPTKISALQNAQNG